VTEPLDASTTAHYSRLSTEDAIFSLSKDSHYIDRCIQLLADRRRRIGLYHLYRADAPVPVRDLATFVEMSVTPPEASISERLLDEAENRLLNTHLPKLRDAELVEVHTDDVELAPDPPVPIQEWLSTTAAVELDTQDTEWPQRDHATEGPIRR
jgi:hypothetical protein